MSELLVTVLRLGYLALLWLFVLSAIGVLRRDIFGTRVLARGSIHQSKSQPAPRARERSRDIRAGTPTRLHITGGRMSGTTMGLGNTSITIGRAPSSSLVLDDDYASSRHARIFSHEGTWYVEDLSSTNGTFLGAHQLHGSAPINSGTPLRIGQTVIELR